MAKKKNVSKVGASAPAVKQGASQEAPAPDAVVTPPVEQQEDAPVVETAAPEALVNEESAVTESKADESVAPDVDGGADPVETETGATDETSPPDETEKPVKQKEETFPGRYTIKNMTRMPLALPVAKAEIKAHGAGDVDIRDADHLKEIRRELDTLAELNGFKNDVFIVAPVAAQ